MSSQSHSFHLGQDHRHLKWNNAIPPVLKVDSGTVISFDLLDGGHNQVQKTWISPDLEKFDFSLADPVVGPVYVNDAQPGDVLKVEFLTLMPASFGWTAIFPGFGLLHDDFAKSSFQLKLWNLHNENGNLLDFAIFKPGIQIPIRPFLGTVGIAPAEPGEFGMVPPAHKTGGNIDTRHIIAGSTLYLPVQVPGALFSCGDGHAAQGDGEVCGSAIETQMKCTIRLSIEKNKPYVTGLHYQTPPAPRHPLIEDKGEYATMGIDRDLLEASRKALRSMIDWLVAEKGLTRVEGYMLSSVAGSLKITEIVDMPQYAVAFSMPLNIFVEE